MCLVTPNKEKKIAEEDMIVYKILNEDLSPFYWEGEAYEIGKLNEIEIQETSDFTDFDEISIRYNKGYKRDELVSFGQGFHSAKSIDRIRDIRKAYSIPVPVLFTCIIPKGSEYYEDNSGLLVSNKIIIKEKYELPDSEG